MKRFLFLLIVSIIPLGILLTSCGGNSKLTPEEEVRNYGKYFVEKLNANQIDSLKASYPDITKADSIVSVKSDTILVAETAPRQYDVTLAEGVLLKVNRSEDGNITVAESKGLFAFPADKLDIARNTGMWDETLSDTQFNERIKDEEFFCWYKDFMIKNSSPVISLEPGVKKLNKKWGSGDYDGQDELLIQDVQEVKIVNHSSEPVSGNDYAVSYGIVKNDSMDPDITSSNTVLKKHPGVDIQPNDSATITLLTDFNMWRSKIVDPKIELKNPNDSNLKNYQATGKEYQEYLNSKK